MMPVEGRVSYSHCGRESQLAPGDFVLLDGRAAGRLEFDEPSQCLHLAVPHAELRARLPSPEGLCGLPGSRERPFGHVVGSLLEDVWRQIEHGFPQEHGAAIARNMLDVIATAFFLQHGERFSDSASMSTRRAHIKRFIEAHLRDPRLSPGFVADYFGVSSRYVAMIFEKERESVSAYVMRRRLEECAHRLAGRDWASQSVTAIAREWCFVNRAHFSRVFKRRFGMSPREYRRSARPSGSTASTEKREPS